MSSNRLIYDTCAYETDMTETANQITYTLDPSKHYQETPTRMELGIVGGNNVSLVKGNLVDMETDLRGLTRYNTRCPIKKNSWIPNDKNIIDIPGDDLKGPLQIDTNKMHLPPGQMIRYEPVALPPSPDLPSCLPPWQQMQYRK